MKDLAQRLDRLITIDPALEKYRGYFHKHWDNIGQVKKRICQKHGDLYQFANLHLQNAVTSEDDHWILKEYAPNAVDIFIIAAFNNWESSAKWAMKSDGQGNFTIAIPKKILPPGSKFKLWITWPGGAGSRIPTLATRVVQDANSSNFNAVLWPITSFPFRNSKPNHNQPPVIYEAHVGMSSEFNSIGTFTFFQKNVLPRIVKAGYNTLQLMAIAEHPYYASFGYQVTNYFAPSSRFGSPEDLKALIDAAHGLGIRVIMDVVHSHSSKNKLEGLSHFDGREDLYFHGGEPGYHPAWDTRCFNYDKEVTLRFLLSNLRYWMEIFQIDGFRFDGVTSMLFHHHGLGTAFSSYKNYFNNQLDEGAWTYLHLANELIHHIDSNALTIAEDVSGFPALALEQEMGGTGFNYGLSMGIPDFWIKLLKEVKDEAWPMGHLMYELGQRRPAEKRIAYAESHDQAMVGDQTLIMRMLGHHIYENMSILKRNPVVERGLNLSKIIKLMTLAFGGEGYLNFMGNEFCHPEWIDFPREGNQWSYKHARRQWSLSHDPLLNYHQMGTFDRDLLSICLNQNWLNAKPAQSLYLNEEFNLIGAIRANNLFLINLHPHKNWEDLAIELPFAHYHLIFHSQKLEYGGFDWRPAQKALGHWHLEKDQLSYTIEPEVPPRSFAVYRRTPQLLPSFSEILNSV